MTAADVLFQPLNPLLGPAPAQPPANIAILPLGTFARTLAPALPTITPANAGSGVRARAQTGTQWQVQAQLDPAALSAGSPTAGLQARRPDRATASSARCPGRSSSSTTSPTRSNSAAGDALYAETLYIMLAVPGALIALGLAYLAALGTVERDRRDLALLRARGATRRDLSSWPASRALVIGLVAGCSAPALALARGRRRRPRRRRAHDRARGRRPLLACVGPGVRRRRGGAARRQHLRAFAASVADSRRAARREAQAALAAALPRLRRPGGQRPHLLADRAHRLLGGRQSRLQPDALALGVHVLRAGPALDRRDAAARAPARPRLLPGSRGGRPAGRARHGARLPARQRGPPRGGDQPRPDRRRPAARLRRQSRHLRRHLRPAGRASTPSSRSAPTSPRRAPPGAVAGKDLPGEIAPLPGVTASTAVDHSYAYVGPDLQDTFGIDPATFTEATTLRDSYFLGGRRAADARAAAGDARWDPRLARRRSPTTR